MGKVSLSVTVDNEIYNLIDGSKNKSETINQILSRALKTEEGIKSEIEYHKNQIMVLENELSQLIQRNINKIENISERLKIKLRDVRKIITNHPDKIGIWTELINRDYETNITKQELIKLIDRWC